MKTITTTNDAALLLKSDKTYVDTQLGFKSNTSDVNDQLLYKASMSYVDEKLAFKSSIGYVNDQLTYKAPLDSPTFTGTLTCGGDLTVSGFRNNVSQNITNDQNDALTSLIFNNKSGPIASEVGQIYCGNQKGLNFFH